MPVFCGQETKQEVCEQNQEMYIVLPTDDTNFENWWKSLANEDEVMVRFPHEQHGVRGKKSKTDVMKRFPKFVDNNSTPNGRQADSHSPTFYFLTKFRRIEPPKLSEKNYSEKIFKLPSQLL